LLLHFQPPIIAYNSIPKETNKAPSRPVPPTAKLPTAPLELDADAEVVLAVLVAPLLLVVVVFVLFWKMPAGVEVDVEFTVTRVAEIVLVDAEVVGPTWLRCRVTVVLAEVTVEAAPLLVEEPLAERPVMLK
jgi:hypothetical protein